MCETTYDDTHMHKHTPQSYFRQQTVQAVHKWHDQVKQAHELERVKRFQFIDSRLKIWIHTNTKTEMLY